MKSLKDISWNVTEYIYRADPAISYSTLAKFDREGFNNLSHLYDKIESPSLTFGSIVDCLITGTEEELNDRFFIADFPELPDKQKTVIDTIFKMINGKESFDKIPDSLILDAIVGNNYQPNWKEETRIRVIREAGKEYYDMLTLAEGKTVITQDMYQNAVECVNALRTSEATKKYFELDNPFDKDTERLYQLKFKGEYDGIPIRCMMDLCVVLHKEKLIIPCDLKTSFKHEWDFPKSFVEWRYYHQAMMYSYILKSNLLKDDYFKDFKIAPYRFIVISNNSRVPLVWEFDQTFSMQDVKLGDNKFRNWRAILGELNTYLKYSPKVPIGIDLNGLNKIERYFNE